MMGAHAAPRRAIPMERTTTSVRLRRWREKRKPPKTPDNFPKVFSEARTSAPGRRVTNRNAVDRISVEC